MSVTALDLEPAFAADLGLADVAREGRALMRLPGGHLFSSRPAPTTTDHHPGHRAYVVTMGHRADADLLPLLLAACEQVGRTTATVTADQVEYAAYGQPATYRWEPAPLLPASVSSLARHTVAASVAVVEVLDPHLVVLGLVDGWTELDHLVQHLRGTDHWEHSVVVALTEPERDLGLVSHWLGTSL